VVSKLSFRSKNRVVFFAYLIKIMRACPGMDILCDRIDKDLFYESTVVTVGKGDMAVFGFQLG
jgi:hypothetical protein